MKVTCFLLFGILLLSGCSSQYRVPPSTPTAELSIMATKIPGSATSRSVGAVALAEGLCGTNPNGEVIANEFKIGHPETVSTTPKRIAAGGQFHFVAGYGDSRMAQNRSCSVEAQFRPLPERKYKGVIIINGDVDACDFALFDITSGQEEIVPFEMSPTMCPSLGLPARPNGRAARTYW